MLSDKQQEKVSTSYSKGGNLAEVKTLGAISQSGVVFRLEKYSAKPDIAGLKDDWQRLERRSSEPFNYFQSFDWCFGFVENFSSSSECRDLSIPQVFVLRNADTNQALMERI